MKKEELSHSMNTAVKDVIDILYSDEIEYILAPHDPSPELKQHMDSLQTFIDSFQVNRYELRERVRLKIDELVKDALEIPFVTGIHFDYNELNDALDLIVPLN